jgi:hypothetical protein
MISSKILMQLFIQILLRLLNFNHYFIVPINEIYLSA